MDNLHLLTSLFNIVIWVIIGFVFGITPIYFNKKGLIHNLSRIILYIFVSLFSGLILALSFGFPEIGIDLGILTVISAMLCIFIYNEGSPDRKKYRINNSNKYNILHNF